MELNVRICAETLQVKKSNTLLQPTLPSSTIALPAASKNRISPLDVCRLWLAQLGILPNESTVGQNHVLILENGVKLERSLKHLDKTPSRETIKIGVVYVGKHQSQQHEILGNTHGSLEYEEFLLELGWPVRCVLVFFTVTTCLNRLRWRRTRASRAAWTTTQSRSRMGRRQSTMPTRRPKSCSTS